MSRGEDTEEENRAYQSNRMEIKHKMRLLKILPGLIHSYLSRVLNMLFVSDSSALFRLVMVGYKHYTL